MKEYLRRYQSEAVDGPDPIPEPVKYAAPSPIEGLNSDDTVSKRGNDEFLFVPNPVIAIRDTPRLQYASANSPRTGPDINAGEQFEVDWLVKAADGNWYYITPAPYWTRVLATDTVNVLTNAAA